MDRSYLGRSVRRSPNWLRKIVRLLLRILLEEIFDGTGILLHLLGRIEQVHLVVFVPHFIGQTTSPRLDLVELVLLLIVTGLANINLLVCREVSWSAFVVAGEEHDEAAVDNLVDRVITILSSLDNFVIVEMAVKAMDCLLWAIVPASIYPFVPFWALPCPIDLRNNRFGQIVGVLEVYPIACSY